MFVNYIVNQVSLANKPPCFYYTSYSSGPQTREWKHGPHRPSIVKKVLHFNIFPKPLELLCRTKWITEENWPIRFSLIVKSAHGFTLKSVGRKPFCAQQPYCTSGCLTEAGRGPAFLSSYICMSMVGTGQMWMFAIGLLRLHSNLDLY